MRSPLRYCPRGTLAAVLAGSLLFTAAACDSGERSAGVSSPEQQDSSPAPDFTLSYDIPERWDPDSVAMVLESSMIGGGVNASGAVVADALYVGEGLNQVKRSTADGTELLDVEPLKQNAAQQDYRIDTFTRQGTDYVALWRKGVPESNDSRRLGDETSSDARVFLSVWDADGSPVFDGPLEGVDEIARIHAGLVEYRGDTLDPLTGEPVDDGDQGDDDGDSPTVVGYGSDASEPLTKTLVPTSDEIGSMMGLKDSRYGTDTWTQDDLPGSGGSGRAEFDTLIGDYAVFSVTGGKPANESTGSGSTRETVAVDISDGTVVARTEDDCSAGFVSDDDKRLAVSPDGRVVTYAQYLIDAGNGILSCQQSRRGNFEPRIVLDDGTVYGYGERGSGDDATQVAASMKIGDEEALMEQGTLPIHVDDQGRGWFADSVNHSRGTDTVVAVVEPAKGGSRS